MKQRCAALLVLLAPLVSGSAPAAELHLWPGESFEAAVESLNPGDTLIVHAGTYVDAGRISIGVRGTAEQPVVIAGAASETRPLVTRSAGDEAQNTINIEGAEHLTIRGLEITSNGGDGIKLTDDPAHITLEDLEIHDIAVGINLRGDMHHIAIRRNHIYATSGTGEGMYVGCNEAACVVSDSLIEQNWIHDTLQAEQGDGIEIKRGSHSNVIRDNVIHDTRYPCILLYGTEGNPRNLVEGNVMWGCGDSGIQAAADSVIRNNLILESPDRGFASQPHQGVTPANLEFVHNTVAGGSPCLKLASWDGRPGLVFANNAVYCASGAYSIGGLSGVVVAGNVLEPGTDDLPAGGYSTGESEEADFIDVAQRDVYPSKNSALRGAGDTVHVTAVDFNGLPRDAADAGAYAWSEPDNPGWPVAPGFKSVVPFADGDGDGVSDTLDNCIEKLNPDQRDTDADGIGNVCDPDLDNDCAVNFSDLATLRSAFFSMDENADLDGDGTVTFGDLAIMKSLFYAAPGPSALPNACQPAQPGAAPGAR